MYSKGLIWGCLMTVFFHNGDLPECLVLNGDIAIDTETTGLSLKRDRLCVMQLSDGRGDAHLVCFSKGVYVAPRLTAILSDPSRVKIFHFARFDVAMIMRCLDVVPTPIYCTKIASKLVRTYTESHGLKDICRELVGVNISKQQQSSDWASNELTKEQLEYAAADVLYLHKIRDKLNFMLKRENRLDIANACFDFLIHRAKLDILGWESEDIFAH
jgi:ribonuclease D